MNYIDTSVLVSALTKEVHAIRSAGWLTAASQGTLAISEWVIAEFSAALSIKLRTAAIDLEARRGSLKALARLTRETFQLLPITSSHLRMAARFADRHDLGLRAPDARHLAIASDSRATLCTLDKRLAGAGRALGVAVTLV